MGICKESFYWSYVCEKLNDEIYIYSSTDNLVVSSIVGTVSVGYMVNYTTIISSLKTLTNSILNPITPIIGNMLALEKSDEKSESVFRMYTYIRFVIACCIITPIIVLIQSFIEVWIGKNYLLSIAIVWLYGMDLYIHIVHSALCDFINGSGLFKENRNIEIVGAICNVVVSISLAYFIGLEGVLIGTIISQSLFWIGRSIVAYRNCFLTSKGRLLGYWITNIIYIVVFVGICCILTLAYTYIDLSFFPLRFILGGLLCEVSVIVTLCVLFGRTEEHRQTVEIICSIFRK